MKRTFFLIAMLASIALRGLCAPPSPPTYLYSNTGNPLTVSCVDTLTSDTTVTTTTATARIVLSTNSRPYGSQKFVVQNSGASTDQPIEYMLGGKVLGTATSGWTAIATATYSFTYSYGTAFKPGDVVYFFNSSTHAIQAYGQIIVSNPSLLTAQIYALGGSAGSPANGSIIGYKNAYTFTAGYGIKVYPTQSSSFITPIYPNYIESILIRMPSAGTAHYRVLQTQ